MCCREQSNTVATWVAGGESIVNDGSSFDLFGGGTQNRVTRKSLVNFLTQEQHKVRPEMVSKLLDEFGDGFTLTRLQLQDLLRRQQGARLAAAQNRP